MPSFGNRSRSNLDECHVDLQRIFEIVILIVDCKIIDGHRPKEVQDRYFHEGRSKVQWPNSKHNSKPSNGVDAIPYPVDWQDRERFVHLMGVVQGVAHSLGIPIRCGGDWNSDDRFDEKFFDGPHYELVD